jgi:hypothetical protein
MTEAEPLMALPFLLLERHRHKEFACFLHENLDQVESLLETAERGMAKGPLAQALGVQGEN